MSIAAKFITFVGVCSAVVVAASVFGESADDRDNRRFRQGMSGFTREYYNDNSVGWGGHKKNGR